MGLWANKNNNDHPRSNHSNHFQYSNNFSNHQSNFSNYHHYSSNHQTNFPNYQQNFPNQAPQSSFQSPPLEKRMTDFEKNMKRCMKKQESLMQTIQNSHTQAITRLEVKISQLINSQNERLKGTLPSQPITNPRNSHQAHLAEDQLLNQWNVVIHWGRKRKLII